MGLLFKPAQFRTAANFCNDMAKGLLLAAVLGQGSLGSFDTPQRLLVSLIWSLFALLSFMAAVSLARYEQ